MSLRGAGFVAAFWVVVVAGFLVGASRFGEYMGLGLGAYIAIQISRLVYFIGNASRGYDLRGNKHGAPHE